MAVSAYADRIERLAERARRDRDAAASSPADDPVDAYLQEGVGPLVACYVEIRTADEPVRLSAREHDLLDDALNDWLECWTLAHGVETDARFTVREAATVFVETHSARHVAELLTGVPSR